jgi:hypothetical protein
MVYCLIKHRDNFTLNVSKALRKTTKTDSWVVPVEPAWWVWYCLEEYSFVGCETVESGRSLPMFLKGRNDYQTPRRGVPEDNNIHTHLLENHKYSIVDLWEGCFTERPPERLTFIIAPVRALGLTQWTSRERLHRPPKRLMHICQTARRHIPEDSRW